MRNRYILLADLPLIAIAAFGAFALRFDWLFYYSRAEFLPYLIAVLLFKPIIFYLFGLYARYWEYASVPDAVAIVTAVLASEVAMAAFVSVGLVLHLLPEFPRSVLLIDSLLTLAMTGGIRLSVRVIAESGGRPARRQADKHVLVVGAGQAGILVVREIQRNPALRLNPVGFLDDDPVKIGKKILGVPVLGTTTAVAEIARLRRADEVIIAMPKAPGPVVRTIANSCSAVGIASRTIPGVFEVLGGQVSVKRLRNVDIADLLRRTEIVGERAPVYLRDRVVLVTGAGGSIGFELCRQIANADPAHLVLLGHGENSIFEAERELHEDFGGVCVSTVIADIRDRQRLPQVFARFRPAIVFHAAAHKHVPLMEENPEEAVSNNVIGTRNVMGAALAAGVERFVMISSDKAVAPSSIMGASKRAAEMIVRDGARRSGRALSVVRFGNVLGSRGSVVTLFKRQIEQGGPVTVTHPEMRRFFMTIPEAVHLVLQAAGLSRGGELFVLEMGEPVRITDLASDLIRLSGFTEEEIPIVFTGVRTGEKLEERLIDEGEVAEPTSHPDVLKVVDAQPRPVDVQLCVEMLAAAGEQGDRLAIETALSQMIPTFVPEWLRTSARS